MSSIVQALKSEIVRVARQQVRMEVAQLRKSSSRYRKEIAELKRQISALRQQQNKVSKTSANAKATPSLTETTQVRFSSARLKKHRERLGLSAENFGKLFGVTGQTVYNWENGTRPGQAHLVMISHLRKLSKRQASEVVATRN